MTLFSKTRVEPALAMSTSATFWQQSSSLLLSAQVGVHKFPSSTNQLMLSIGAMNVYLYAFMTLLTSSILLYMPSHSWADQSSTYDEVLKGKQCATHPNLQTLSCEYKVGADLHLSIDGIGQEDTGVTFMKSNAEGDFYATYGILHGCFVVKRGPKSHTEAPGGPGSMSDYAFISPRSGKVYRSWSECKSEM